MPRKEAIVSTEKTYMPLPKYLKLLTGRAVEIWTSNTHRQMKTIDEVIDWLKRLV